MTKTTKSLIALLLSLFVICSFMTVSVFATGEESTTVSESSSTEAETTTAAESSTTAAESTSETESGTVAAGTTDEKKGMSQELIVNLIIVAVIIVAGVVLCIVFRAKLIPFMLAVKSDRKKISWQSWKDTRKNTLVVLVVVIAAALMIFILDYGFSNGVKELANLFS